MDKNNNYEVPPDVRDDPAQIYPPTQIILEQVPVLQGLENAPRLLKNIPYAKAVSLVDMIDYAPGQVISKTLAQNPAVGITLFAIAAGEGISAHKSGGDAFVTALDGSGEITIDNEKYVLAKGQSIVMPAGHPHAVSATENLKMLLVVVFLVQGK